MLQNGALSCKMCSCLVRVPIAARYSDLQMRLYVASISPAGLACPVEYARRAAGTPAQPARRLPGPGWLVEVLRAGVALRGQFAPVVERSSA
jgi:hypothetical protein